MSNLQLTTCKTEHEGSVVVEVGSERCDSEGHDTDIENPHDLNAQNKDQIETLKGTQNCITLLSRIDLTRIQLFFSLQSFSKSKARLAC